MKLVLVDKNYFQTYLNLAQCYEAEFSSLTHKQPNSSGVFELDTHLGESVNGFILMIDETPAGIAAVRVTDRDSYEMCEFYIVPCFRKNGAGIRFSHMLWEIYTGKWEIKQIDKAQYATVFWRKAITQYKDTHYIEDRYTDPYWGCVTRQTFVI